MPVFFRFAERDIGLTDEEAADLADRLARTALRDQIMLRVGIGESSPLPLDGEGEEQERHLLALYAALDAIDFDGQLTFALTNLRKCVIDGMGERTWSVSVVRALETAAKYGVFTYRGLLPESGAVISVVDDGSLPMRVEVKRLTPADRRVQVHGNELEE